MSTSTAAAETTTAESSVDPGADPLAHGASGEENASGGDSADASTAAANDNGQEMTPEQRAEAEKAALEAQAAADRKAKVDTAVQRAQARMKAKEAQRRAQQQQRYAQARLEQQLGQERAAREAAEARAKALQDENPWQAAERRGATVETLAQELIRRGTPEEKIVALQRQLAESERKAAEWRANLEKQHQQREQQIRDAEAKNTIIGISHKNADRHELLMARYGTEQALTSAVTAMAQRGYEKTAGRHSYSAEDVLEFLESETRQLADRLIAKAKPGSPKAAGKPESKVVGTAGQTGSRAGNSAPRTLTNGSASETYSLPADFEELPEDKQNQHLAEMYRRLTTG